MVGLLIGANETLQRGIDAAADVHPAGRRRLLRRHLAVSAQSRIPARRQPEPGHRHPAAAARLQPRSTAGDGQRRRRGPASPTGTSIPTVPKPSKLDAPPIDDFFFVARNRQVFCRRPLGRSRAGGRARARHSAPGRSAARHVSRRQADEPLRAGSHRRPHGRCRNHRPRYPQARRARRPHVRPDRLAARRKQARREARSPKAPLPPDASLPAAEPRSFQSRNLDRAQARSGGRSAAHRGRFGLRGRCARRWGLCHRLLQRRRQDRPADRRRRAITPKARRASLRCRSPRPPASWCRWKPSPTSRSKRPRADQPSHPPAGHYAASHAAAENAAGRSDGPDHRAGHRSAARTAATYRAATTSTSPARPTSSAPPGHR